MWEHLTHEDVVDAVDRVIVELLEKAGIRQPPVDAISLAQNHLGIVVCLDRNQQQRGRAQRSGRKDRIYLRPEPTEERHQWTVAHEIGEHMKATLLAKLGVSAEETKPMSGESLANLFAHHLLVPTQWFRADAPAFEYNLLALKAQYHTASHEVLAMRLLDLPQPCIVTIVDNDRVHRRRSNSQRVRKQLEPIEKKCQRMVHNSGQAAGLSDGEWSVQGWPVHQAGWKREILRSVVEGWE